MKMLPQSHSHHLFAHMYTPIATESSALHQGADNWVLEVEFCLPVSQIVHLHPTKTLHAHRQALIQSSTCQSPGRAHVCSECNATVAKDSTAGVSSEVAVCKDGAVWLLAAQPVLWNSHGSEGLLQGRESPKKGQGTAGNTSRLSLQSAVSVEIRANALAHSCPAKGYIPSGP